ncbi:coiled-coil domain-containing protein 39-like [Dysidea avara]|uniref:coiled-coil domain-containing protein 39-like n=1 Tax=Dysidea avara TaxID=196820 RepID=UPI003317DE5C
MATDAMDMDLDLDRMGLAVANEENKLLEVEVQQKQKLIGEINGQLSEYSERVAAMREHMKNVRQELHHTQGIYGARKRDLETEEHMKQIAEREQGRLKSEIQRLDNEIADLKDKMNSFENNCFRYNKKIEDLKKEMNWDQQALEAWLEQTAQKDDDVMTMQKYAQADQSRVKDMNLKQERLLEARNQKSKALENEVTETLTAQIEFDKTAEAFRRTHMEREELIKQWEQTINLMKKRDSDMDKLANDLAEINKEKRIKDSIVEEKKQFLEGEIENNAEEERRLSQKIRQVAKYRLEYQDLENARIQYRDELETLKYSVDRVGTDYYTTRAQVNHLSRELQERKERLEKLKHKHALLDEELHKKAESTLTSEGRAEEMDKLLLEEETRITQLSKELEKIRDKEFKRLQEVSNYKQEEQNCSDEIQGCRATLRNLASKQNKVDKEALKQQEILYTQDFQLQQLEHRMARLQGERSDDEKIQLQTKIKELEAEWESQQNSAQILQHQLKRLQDDLRKVSRHLDRDCKEKDINTGKIEELNLHIDSLQRELRKAISNKQNLMVDENIIKLEVKKLREILFSHADEVLTLEQRQLRLQTAMTERAKEITIHKEMLQTQMKTIETERQTISTELHERISKIEKLRKRYEILTVAMAPPEGEEEHSQAYYVIKAAQEREELQRTGDHLDAKIRKAEKEIRALENTLRLMNDRNETYRKSLNKADSMGEEVSELDSLEGQLRMVMDKFRRKRKLIKEVQQDLQTMSNTLQSLNGNNSKYGAKTEDVKFNIAQRTKEIEEQKVKLDRVGKQTSKLLKEIKAKKGSGPEESDIELRDLRDFNVNITQQLSQISVQQSELQTPMQLLFSQAGLPPPSSAPGSRSSSQQSSSHSSTVASRTSSRSTPSTLVHAKTVQPGDIIGRPPASEPSTPRSGVSQLSSRSSTHRKRISRPASKQSSSRHSSAASKDLGLFIGPSHKS